MHLEIVLVTFFDSNINVTTIGAWASDNSLGEAVTGSCEESKRDKNCHKLVTDKWTNLTS